MPSPGKDVAETPGHEKFPPLLPTGSPEPRRPSPRALGLAGLGVLAVVLAVVIALVVGGGSGPTPTTVPKSTTVSPALSSSGGWTVPGVRVLGGPVLSGGRLLAVVTTAGDTLALEALEPETGAVEWEVPYSASEINAGIVLSPTVSSDVVLDLAPVGPATSPGVVLKGVAVDTGKVLWTTAGAMLVTDSPATCTSRALFCVDEIDAQGSNTLSLLQPSNGSVVAEVPGLYRQLAPGLYETGAAPAGIERLDSSGHSAWMVPVQSLFGSQSYSPDYGWAFGNEGDLEVGSVGIALSGASVPLGQYKTIAIRTADGTVAWSAPGSYQCMGAVVVDAPFLCRYSGSGKLSGLSVTAPGVSMTIEGVDPHSGSIRWSQQVNDAQQFTQGDDVVVAGTTKVVVALPLGSDALLDLSSGTKAPVPRGATYWCSSIPAVSVVAPSAALADGGRTGATLYSPCTATGATSAGIPSVAPANVGVAVGGLFVWAAPEGLRALPLAH